MEWSSGHKPHDVVKEQARLALRKRNDVPGTWSGSSHSQQPLSEGDPIRRISAGQRQARAAVTAATANPFSNEHNIDDWTCPKCRGQGTTSPERVENLKRNGRYYFECEMAFCGATLVAKKRKDSATVKVEEFRLSPGSSVRAKAKKRWAKSKDYMNRTGMAVADGFARLTGLRYDSDSSDSYDTTVRRPSGPLRSGPRRKYVPEGLQAALKYIDVVETGVVSQEATTVTRRRRPTTLTPTGGERLTNAHAAPSKCEAVRNSSATRPSWNSSNTPISMHPLSTSVAGSQGQNGRKTQQTQQTHTVSSNSSQPGQFCYPGSSQSAEYNSRVAERPAVGEDDDGELFYSRKIEGCSRTFSTGEQRLEHHVEDPGDDEDFFLCRVCRASFLTKTSRRKHELEAGTDPTHRRFEVIFQYV